MNMLHTALAGFMILLGLLSFMVNAKENHTNKEENFQSICINTWMERQVETKDNEEYRLFGKQYCECASKESLDNDDAIDQAIRLCMTQTIADSTVKNIQKTGQSTKVSETDIVHRCLATWKLIYADMDAQLQQVATAFCNCTKSELYQWLKKPNKMTNEDSNSQIRDITLSCLKQLEI